MARAYKGPDPLLPPFGTEMTRHDITDPDPITPKLRVRVVFGEHTMLGPGKADLLEHIEQTGSISAAGRAMNMSYKRAWLLVDTMNAAFQEALVESSRGGPQGGGASLTATGKRVLARYRALEARLADAGKEDLRTLRDLLKAPE